MGIKDQNDSRLEEATKKVYKEGFHSGIMNKNCGKYEGTRVTKAKDSVKQELLESRDADLFYGPSRPALCRCGGKVIVANVRDQWFIDFKANKWKEIGLKCLAKMKIHPETFRKQFLDTFDWLDKRPVARRRGLGTPLPFDKRWMIESLSDSTIYMSLYTINNLLKK